VHRLDRLSGFIPANRLIRDHLRDLSLRSRIGRYKVTFRERRAGRCLARRSDLGEPNNRATDALRRMTASDLSEREAGFDDLMSAVAAETPGGALDLPDFFARHKDLADPIYTGHNQ
jgi:hypothetical protein